MSESICLKCENKKICAMGIKQPSSSTTVTGCSRFEEKEVITNADRIRSMTDNELTRFFAENCGCGDWCMHHRSGACANKPENECCLDVWHKWLKSPADKDGA